MSLSTPVSATPLTPEQVTAIEAAQSRYGCGADACLACYPLQYGCEWCYAELPNPIPNGQHYDCESCGWEGNREDDPT